MINEPLVSVIIAFLNPGTWLVEAIESVLHQTYPHWEIMLIDDGSDAEDASVARKYAEQYSGKIFYYEHEAHVNKGLPTSRNLGIKMSHGEMIAFLDADDYWMPRKLVQQLKLFEAMPAVQMVCESSLFWYSWQDENKANEITDIGALPGIYQPPALLTLLYPFGTGQPPCPSGIIVKRSALERAGGFEEAFAGMYQLYEDQAFLFKFYSTETIYISRQVNNQYRKREHSMSSAATNPAVYKTVRNFFIRWVDEYLAANGMKDDVIAALVAGFKQTLAQEADPE